MARLVCMPYGMHAAQQQLMLRPPLPATGDELLVSERTPGVFLQGLAVHGLRGRQLTDAQLPESVVADAFAYAQAHELACVAFLGDACATLRMTPELEELHTRYYEPEAQVGLQAGSHGAISLAGVQRQCVQRVQHQCPTSWSADLVCCSAAIEQHMAMS